MPKTPSKEEVLKILVRHGFDPEGPIYSRVAALWEPTTIERLDACGENAYVVHPTDDDYHPYVKIAGLWFELPSNYPLLSPIYSEPIAVGEVAYNIEESGFEIIFEGVK